jgi:hypothetical protein
LLSLLFIYISNYFFYIIVAGTVELDEYLKMKKLDIAKQMLHTKIFNEKKKLKAKINKLKQ